MFLYPLFSFIIRNSQLFNATNILNKKRTKFIFSVEIVLFSQKTNFMSITYIIIGLILLVVGGEFLVRSSVGLSLKLNISKMIIGMTVVSFATSAPELLVSIQAALDNSPAIAINNVIGSNIANIGLVLGITSLISPIAIGKDFYRINWLTMMLFSFVIYYFLWNDNILIRTEGILLFTSLIVFLIILIKSSTRDFKPLGSIAKVFKLLGKNNKISEKADDKSKIFKPLENNKLLEEVDEKPASVSYTRIFIWLFASGVALYFGSELLVSGAKELAKGIGVSEGVISITVIAIGTSVPELAASIIAAIKGEKAISLGNLIGSNIFNIASVLGLTSMIKSIEVNEPQILTNDILWMLGFAIILLPLALIPVKNRIGRRKGVLLIASYIVFIYCTVGS